MKSEASDAVARHTTNVSPLLVCQDLSKRFDGLQAVDRVSLAVRPQTVTAIVGPNGAGKTTLFHLLAGTVTPDEGGIWLRGARIDRLAPWQVARHRVGRLFQDVRVFERMTVFENVLTAVPNLTGERPMWNFVLRSKAMVEERAALERTREAIGTVGLKAFENTLAGNLSFGQQKLVAFGRLLVSGAQLLLLDEPTAGIDESMRTRIGSLLRTFAAAGGTVLFVEHNLKAVAELADEVHYMELGRIVLSGAPGYVLGDPAVRRSFVGL